MESQIFESNKFRTNSNLTPPLIQILNPGIDFSQALMVNMTEEVKFCILKRPPYHWRGCLSIFSHGSKAFAAVSYSGCEPSSHSFKLRPSPFYLWRHWERRKKTILGMGGDMPTIPTWLNCSKGPPFPSQQQINALCTTYNSGDRYCCLGVEPMKW